MANLSTKTGLPSFSAVDASIVNYFSDPGFERGTDGTLPSGWLQYNDGAVAVPVNGTGGSANASVTFLTTTAGAIRGTKSALLTKGPGNQQGTGYSYDFTISSVDKGVTAGVDFELVTSSNYASGDVVFYIYDVTNSVLITPRAVSLPALPNYGKFFSDYGLQTGTQYRFILHIATTNASAWTMMLDTMTNSTTRNSVPGAPVTGWKTDLVFPVPTGLGTGSVTNTARYYQSASTMVLKLRSLKDGSGGSGGSSVIYSMPAGYTIDTANLPNNLLGVADFTGTNYGNVVQARAASSTTFTLVKAGTASNFTGVDFTANGELNFQLIIPIVEWSGAGTNGPASVTQWASDDGTSDVLGPQGSLVPNVAYSTGTTTRVFSFSVPQDLRQFVRVEYNRSGNGWGAASDLYPFSGGNNAGTTNFYGVRGEWISSTSYQVSFGNQGTRVNSSAASNGTDSWATEFSGGSRFRVGLSIGGVFIGINLVNATQSGFARAYNDLAKIRLNTSNGHGSINTKIRRFSTVVVNTGIGITYADSATAGATFTCTEAGVYSFEYADAFSAAGDFGLSLNTTQQATNIGSITAADRLVHSAVAATDFFACVSITIALAVGDIVRPHTSGNTDSSVPGRVSFTVQRVV